MPEAMSNWVQRTPVGELKSLPDARLQEIREALVKEVRAVGRALHWIDGIIKLKRIEREAAHGSTSHDHR